MFTMTTGINVGDRVRALRQQRGWSMRQLGEKAETSHAYISLLERGKLPKPGLDLVEKIAGAFGVTVADLMGERGDAAHNIKEDPALYAGTDSGGHTGSVPADALLREERKSLEVIAKVLDTVINLEEYIEDTPSILEKWAALPPNEIILIADMIATLSTRKRFNKSGRVRRDAQPEPSIRIHREDVVTAVRVLGSSAMLLPNPEPPQLEEPRGA